MVVDDMVRADGNDPAQAVADEIGDRGGEAYACHGDVTTVDGAQLVVDEAQARFGTVDILVNCAGNTVRAGIADLTEQQWDSVLDLHLKGHFLMSQAAARVMLPRNQGRIITVSSRSAFETLPDTKRQSRSTRRKPSCVAYAAAKAGVLGFTSTLALELWDTGITVNCLLPSAVTQLFPGTSPRAVGGLPPSRDMDPATCAPLVVYLAGDSGAHISGRFFYASGGDICVYRQPLQAHGATNLLRNPGTWTVDELEETLSPVLGEEG